MAELPSDLLDICTQELLDLPKKPSSNIWYTSVPIGHNTLTQTVKRLCSAGGISGYKTNHSLRVTTASRLFQNGVPEQLIMELCSVRRN